LVRQHEEQSDATGPHIYRSAEHFLVSLGVHDFWSHEAERTYCPFQLVTTILKELADSKVAQDHLPLLIEHHVLRLEVSMSNVRDLVAIVYSGDELPEVVTDTSLIESLTLLLYLLLQCATFEEVHD